MIELPSEEIKLEGELKVKALPRSFAAEVLRSDSIWRARSSSSQTGSTLLVAAAVSVGNYFGNATYDGVKLGFDQQSWMTWLLPLAVVVGLIVLGVICLGLIWCWKKRGAKRRSGRPSARSTQVAPSDA